ncbi:hypothetical protein ACFU53_00485 [Streptomyces sp. NPDC057474]|uniref:hypothetical protein n=1 Tax=Streptomyces sp. NPDC057474 TaxID=3346144 RepID=UPI0036879A75
MTTGPYTTPGARPVSLRSPCSGPAEYSSRPRPADGAARAALADRTPSDPIATAADAALTALAEAAHHGLRRLPRSVRDRLREAADRLTRTGLTTSSNLLRRLLDTREHDHDPTYGNDPAYGQDPTYGQDPVYGRNPAYGQDPLASASTAWTDAGVRLHAAVGLSRWPPAGSAGRYTAQARMNAPASSAGRVKQPS